MPANTAVFAFAQSGSSLFAATNNGLFISLNQGQSWTAVSTGLPNTGIVSLAVNGTNIFAGTVGHGVYRSNY